jgi:hypothetical protein
VLSKIEVIFDDDDDDDDDGAFSENCYVELSLSIFLSFQTYSSIIQAITEL